MGAVVLVDGVLREVEVAGAVSRFGVAVVGVTGFPVVLVVEAEGVVPEVEVGLGNTGGPWAFPSSCLWLGVW